MDEKNRACTRTHATLVLPFCIFYGTILLTFFFRFSIFENWYPHVLYEALDYCRNARDRKRNRDKCTRVWKRKEDDFLARIKSTRKGGAVRVLMHTRKTIFLIFYKIHFRTEYREKTNMSPLLHLRAVHGRYSRRIIPSCK